MNSIVHKTVTFNKLGASPVGFSPNNMENAYGIFEEEVDEVYEGVCELMNISLSHELSATQASKVATDILDGAVDTVVTAIGILYRMGMTAQQIDQAFEVVADSNLSKFANTIDEAEESVEKYEQDERYKNVGYKVQDGQYVIFGAKTDGTADYKILKGINWKEPSEQLSRLVGDIYVERD